MRVAPFLAAVLLCGSIGHGAFPAVRAAGAPREAEDLKALRTRIESLKAELDQKEATRRESRDALRESERAISDAGRELRALETESRAAQEELKGLSARRRALGEGLEHQQAALGRMLAARYASGASDPLRDAVRVALSGKDPNDAARDLYYLGMLSRAAARLLGTFRANAAELEQLAQAVRDKAASLEAIEAGKRTERERILAESRERKRVLERLAGDIRANRREIKVLVADESRLARLVEEIGKVLSAKPGAGYARRERIATDKVPEAGAEGADGPFSQLRGKLRLPVRGELLARFGSQRKEGGGSSKGIFIRSAEGQPVRSIAAGRVVFADWMRGFGNLLIVDHGETYLSVYGNNETLLKQPGDPVSPGEPIATVGSTGGSAETGLYFELRYLGKAFDPLRWSNLR
ncbi:MAG: peptidoglycan DD-metalloendopeptidase family protein [Proteobacteria bacterium]|nr:peptidoglycan DD-metalloendopeptidase family protein [Pseudomonadota bacterium]